MFFNDGFDVRALCRVDRINNICIRLTYRVIFRSLDVSRARNVTRHVGKADIGLSHFHFLNFSILLNFYATIGASNRDRSRRCGFRSFRLFKVVPRYLAVRS